MKSSMRAELSVELGSAPPFPVKARIVWSNLELVGVEVAALPPEGISL